MSHLLSRKRALFSIRPAAGVTRPQGEWRRWTPMNPYLSISLVALGGALGSAARYSLSGLVQGNRLGFPWGTLAVNLIGCLLIGALMAWLELGILRAEWRHLLVIGVLGGFTTFSAFSYETIHLVVDGNALTALAYAGASLVGCLLLTAVSYLTVHNLWR
jgi:fluoride exporter